MNPDRFLSSCVYLQKQGSKNFDDLCGSWKNMSDQSRLTTIRNTSVNDHTGASYTDIHAETISNVLNLRNNRKQYSKKQNGGNNFRKTFLERLTASRRDFSFNSSPVFNSFVPFSEIENSHFGLGSLVNIPEVKRRQLALIMARNSDKARKIKNKNGNDDIARTTVSEIESNINSTWVTPTIPTPTTSNAKSFEPETTKTASSTKHVRTSISTKDTEFTNTKPTAVTTTGLFSSEETVTVTIENTDPSFTNNNAEVGNDRNGEEDIILTQDELEVLTSQDENVDFKVGMTPGSGLNIDTIMFPSQRASATKRRRDRINFCGTFSLNFGNRRIGLNCCMRTLDCFDGLPIHVDESIFHRGRHQYSQNERTHLCYDLNDAFTCTRRILARQNCQVVANLLDRRVKPQMTKARQFYRSICPPDPGIFTTPSVRKTTNSTSSLGTTGWGPIPSSLLPFIGGAFAGLFLIVILMLVIIFCRRKCGKRKRRIDNQETNDGPNQSPRYKSVKHLRRKSSVYEEIDENQMVGSPAPLKYSKSSSPPEVPSAPKPRSENHYYLSPTSSLPGGSDKKPTELGLTNFGYLELQTDENGQSYAKLKTDGEYLSIDEIATVQQKDKPSKEEYHTYFVLEKDEDHGVDESLDCLP